MEFGLADNTLKKIQQTFSEYGKVEQVLIFGSRAKGNYKPGSDIDLAVLGKNLNFDDVIKLQTSFENLNLPYKIDIIRYDTINKDVRDHIDRNGKVLFYRAARS